jgi:hypothetical protein
MSGILLGPSANKIQYNSNMQGAIKTIELNQAKQNFNRPEYLNQFDELRFDNIDNPSGENDTYKTIIGYNASLKRDLMVRDNYSFFDNTKNGTYNVVTSDNFTHNNMMPSTTQRDINKSDNFSQRKLEAFTGSSANYVAKSEKIPLFEPMKDLTNINGMPVMTTELQQRYLPSNKNNNGNLPFETKIRVAPGVGNQVQEGKYAVYRMNPPDVDKLRSSINKKITYNNMPLETIKKGELRGTDLNLTKFKLPDYRVQNFDDLIPNAADVPREKQDGEYTNMATARGDSQHYLPGPSAQTTVGDGPDLNKTHFQTAKKESFATDYTHNIMEVNNKPVFTNAQSWGTCPTQRASVNTNYQGPIQNSTTTYNKDYNDKARQTIKQTTSHDIISNFNNTSRSQYAMNNDKAKQTIKQTTSHDIVSNFNNTSNSQYVMNNDKAKQTIKQMTSHDIVSNLNPVTANSQYVMNNDKAKKTIKQTTSHDIVSNLNPATANSQYVMNNDKAKQTIKQTTSHDIISNLNAASSSQYVMNNDKAKQTIKQTTTHNIISNLNPATSNSQYVMNNDKAKQTLKQTTINNKQSVNISSYIKDGYTNLTEPMKETIKQTTLVSKRPEGNMNTISGSLYYAKDKNDTARETIKQTTENTKYLGAAVDTFDNATYSNLQDTMRQTTKQTTVSAQPISNLYLSTNVNYARNPNDKTRNTIKQTIINNTYAGNLRSDVEGRISHEAAQNMHQNLCREATTYNRPANGRKDQTGPYFNNETFELNEPLLYGYMGNAHKALDHTVTPTLENKQIININNVKTKSKPIIDMSHYYINNNFINTLENNPLVNDIYHQKNLVLNL